MSEIIVETGQALDEGYEQVVRIPAGVMNLVRQSYDTRERVLDWMLAFFVAGALIYAFWGPIVAMVKPPKDPNAGKTDVTPNQDYKNACSGLSNSPSRIYTYNMPQNRNLIASRVGPSSTRIPVNPGFGPQYNPDFEQQDTTNAS